MNFDRLRQKIQTMEAVSNFIRNVQETGYKGYAMTSLRGFPDKFLEYDTHAEKMAKRAHGCPNCLIAIGSDDDKSASVVDFTEAPIAERVAAVETLPDLLEEMVKDVY